MTQYSSLAKSLGEIKVKIYEIRRLYLLVEEAVRESQKSFLQKTRFLYHFGPSRLSWTVLAALNYFGPFWPANIVPNIWGWGGTPCISTYISSI